MASHRNEIVSHKKSLVTHKKHRNVLYGMVVVLAILQIITFVVLSSQVTQINVKINRELTNIQTDLQKSNTDLRKFTSELMATYDELYQQNFNEISSELTEQKADFAQKIKLLKSDQEDFSDIIEDAVKSVVTVSTGRSIGTGFIVHKDGFIVTNYHVIAGQEEQIKVITHSRERLPATLVGIDEVRDLALLQIASVDYTPLPLGDSDDLQAGKKVIAIGNPLGLSFTVTEGIVSAVDRRGPSGLAEYVQTDVSLNPGNSGGPLIDTTGHVVGINNFKIGGAESLGFSLESDAIRETINLIANQTLIS